MTAFVDDAHEFFQVRRVCLRIVFRGITLFYFSCDTHVLICQFAVKILVVEQQIFLQCRELALYQLWNVRKIYLVESGWTRICPVYNNRFSIPCVQHRIDLTESFKTQA